MKVTVAGALAAKPWNGGEAWVRLSYILGLRSLGLHVSLVEQVGADPPAEVLRWFRAVAARFSIDATLVDAAGAPIDGSEPEGGDALVNISGNLTAPALLGRFRRRAYVDLDPCFTQVWHAAGALSLDRHHVHYTVGENVGTRRCSVPTNGIPWRPMRPPVVLADWPLAPSTGFDRFTTVATWRPGHGSVAIAGKVLGLRVHAFRRVIDLPRLSELPFEAALAIDAREVADLALLTAGGWHLVEPHEVAAEPESFREYVAASGAEFSVAQEAYTATRTGWIGDRTVRYLASGRPAIVEDTGIRSIPTGQGLVTFSTLCDARAAARDVVENYEAHRVAARALAVEHFDAKVVLGRLLEDLL
jgi:hypothetical protein